MQSPIKFKNLLKIALLAEVIPMTRHVVKDVIVKLKKLTTSQSNILDNWIFKSA